jgi:hypothetical protein
MRKLFIFIFVILTLLCGAVGFFYFKYPDSDFSKYIKEKQFKSAAEEAVEIIEEYIDDCEFIEKIFDKDKDEDEDEDEDARKVKSKCDGIVKNEEKNEPKSQNIAYPPPRKLDGDWYCIGRESYCSGPKLSSSKLKDAVVLVYAWDCDRLETAKLMNAVEDIWKSFNHKNFKVVASNRGNKTAKGNKFTGKYSFSFYDGFSYRQEPSALTLPCLYVVTSSGKLVNCSQNHRMATQVIVTAFAEQYERSKSKR